MRASANDKIWNFQTLKDEEQNVVQNPMLTINFKVKDT